MNTLSRLDYYLSSFISIPSSSSSSSSSSSKPTLSRTVTPPGSSSSNTGAGPLSTPRLSNLPPTPRSKRRYKTSSNGNPTRNGVGPVGGRRKKVVTTYSSIKVPPPTTPLILRIALVLWSILLAFWRSLVGETRSGRSRSRSRSKRNKTTADGLRELGESLMVSAGISSPSVPVPDNQIGKLEGEVEQEGSSSEIERDLLETNENETEQEEGEGEGEEDWIDPLVTRAPSDQPSLDKPPPSEDDFAITTINDHDHLEEKDSENRNPKNFTFRLKSAPNTNTTTTTLNDPSIDGENDLIRPLPPHHRQSITNLQKPLISPPTSILSNPTPKIISREDQGKEQEGQVEPKPEKARKSGILANPISTSILDPSVPAPISKNDSIIFRTKTTTPTSSSTSSSLLSANTHGNGMKIPRHITTPFHLQKTLILDLDETLIHSTSRPLSINAGSSGGGGILGLSLSGLMSTNSKNRSKGVGSREGHSVEVVLNGRSTMYHVYKRPYVDHFLKKVASWYTLVIFTASMPEYADPVIEWLDAGRNLFAKRLYRESCHLQPNGSYIKDLSLVEKDLSRVCFMDNSPVSYNWNKANALPIEGWTSDPNDEALLQSIPVLDSLRFVNDVRRVLGIRGFT
ncbi:uncharacterized protein L199_003974 [Kwoniella botswanensis]|uniref:uncharacterized protein n=1 Tax=Kwoniella botswanensis TaxID=1268659 RepID=UPI00315DFAC6